jgi:protein-disulfide isomerase
LKLPDLEGQIVGIDELPAKSVLLIFWNPNCGFCAEMLADLKALEQRIEAHKILLISRGSVEANLAMELQSKILLDRNFSAGTAFGVAGTPSAIWIDGKKDIASAAAVGATNVLALAANGPTQFLKPTLLVQ